jgi:hypothetical protein
MGERALVLGGVIAGILGALWFSTVVAMGPPTGSVSPQQKDGARESAQSTAQPGTTKNQKQPRASEEEKYCGGRGDQYLCIIQLRAAVAAENQARYALWGFGALIATLVLSTFATFAAASSARSARRVLSDLERPHVFVEVPDAGLSPPGSDGGYRFAGGRFEYRCINYGRTAAELTEVLSEIRVEVKGAFPRPIDPDVTRGRSLPTGCVATRDAPYPEGDTAMKTYPAKLLDRGAWQKYSIFFIGYVRYRDMIFGATYINVFCFVYDPIGDKFVRRGNNESYNYTRRDEPEPAGVAAAIRKWL